MSSAEAGLAAPAQSLAMVSQAPSCETLGQRFQDLNTIVQESPSDMLLRAMSLAMEQSQVMSRMALIVSGSRWPGCPTFRRRLCAVGMRCPLRQATTSKHPFPFRLYPAQQDNFFTSLSKVWAASFNPSTVVRYGKIVSARSSIVRLPRIASAAV